MLVFMNVTTKQMTDRMNLQAFKMDVIQLLTTTEKMQLQEDKYIDDDDLEDHLIKFE